MIHHTAAELTRPSLHPVHESTNSTASTAAASIRIENTAETYWVDAGKNGDGTRETSPAGNITYLLTTKVSSHDTIKVQPGIYNTSIGETFPLNVTDYSDITLKATSTPANTIIKGEQEHTGLNVTTDYNKITGFTLTNFANSVKEAGIMVTGSSHNTISHNTITNNTKNGIYLHYNSINNTISHNNVVHNHFGISIEGGSHENIVSHNTVTKNKLSGIHILFSGYTRISNNTITNTGTGISLGGSPGHNTISLNTITNNSKGIGLTGSSHNTISHNTITNNEDGIELKDSSTGNLVYHNNFLRNSVNARDLSGENAFNTSTIGNYWSDYGGNDTDGDGIGDTPYSISGVSTSKDYLPAIKPFNIVGDKTDPKVSISFPAKGSVLKTSKVTVEWNGSDEGTGIYHYAVQIDDGPWETVDTTNYTFTDLSDAKHMVTVKAVDRAGNTATDSVTFTVSAGKARGYPTNLIGIGIGVAVIVAAIAIYLLKIRKT